MSNTKKISELRKVLKKHHTLLSSYLENKNILETEFYLPIAAQLRVLLCDNETPILLTYANLTNQILHIYGPRKLPRFLLKNLLYHTNYKIANSVPFGPICKKYEINEYLDLPIGHISIDKSNLNGLPQSYTVTQLIKWVSNKEGICHLDFKKPGTFTKLKSIKIVNDDKEIEDGLIKSYIIQMAKWIVNAIQNLLSVQQDFSVLLKIKLIQKPKEKIRLFRLKSNDTDRDIVLSASVEEFIFEVYYKSFLEASSNIPYPYNWRKNRNCILALNYEAKSNISKVFINGWEMKQQLKSNLGGMINGKPDGLFLKGNHFNFKGEILLYSRHVTQKDMLELFEVSDKWFKTLDPNIVHKVKTNIFKKMYIYFYKILFVRHS